MEEHEHILPTTQGSFSVEELTKLFEDRGHLDLLRKFGSNAEICAKLQVSPKNGVSKSQTDNAWRQQLYGSNVYPERKYKGFWALFLEALKDTTLIILMVAAVVSLVLGITWPNAEEGETRATGWIDGASILLAVLVVSTVNAGNNYQKDKQFRILEKEKNNDNVFAIRDGESVQVRVFDVIVGDIIVLQRGDKIPADGIMLEGKEVKVDQAPLTGESFPVSKALDKDPFLLSGCILAEGDAKMIVLAVGTNSLWGKVILELDEAEDVPTPLQEDLEELAKRIGWVGTGCAVVVFLVLTMWWVAEHFIMKTLPFEWASLEDFVQFFIISVTIVVVAVPEGLPLAVTISLAYSMRKMMTDKNLVRHLKACETMGGVTNICTDKTGTLTENRMKVVQGWAGGSLDIFNALPNSTVSVLTEGISVNSKANVKKNGLTWEFLGNKTECALLVYCNTLGPNYLRIREENPSTEQFSFSSERKRMTTVIPKNGKLRVHTKGAPEALLDVCTTAIVNGSVVPMSEDLKAELNKEIHRFAQQGLRTIALAFRDVDSDFPQKLDKLEADMTFIGVFGIEDPLRPEVRDAVRHCKKAGVTVRMVTGDNIETARKIATECGIMEEGCIALEGPAFRKLPDDDLNSIRKLRVLARSTPQDKKLLVQRLKRLGEVVAVTGDGTNDAIALSEAHVGLAMGIEGTGVAKQASDIIILDDNFSSIVKSVMWGRNVRGNIQKFLQFQLTVNVVALVIAVIAAVTGKGTPLKAIQLLWVNLIMDTLAALALGTEAPDMSLLDRPPVGRNYPLVSSIMWRNILGQSAYQLAVLFGILYAGHHLVEYQVGSKEHYTFLFNAFVFCQIFNEFNCRKIFKGEWNILAGIHKNWLFSAVLLVIVGGQIIIVEFGEDFMKTVPLSLEKWGYSVLIGLGSIIVGYILKLLPAPEILCCKIKASTLEDINVDETRPLVDK